MGITQLRVELKYRVPSQTLPEVVRRLPGGDRRTYSMTTTYLDKPDHSLSRIALETPFQSTKIRLREYWNEPGRVWVEIKVRSWAWTRKWRFPMGKSSVEGLLRGELPEAATPPSDATEREVHEVSEAFHRLREGKGRLSPLGCVTTTRTTFSYPEEMVRFSLDEKITYYRAPRRLYPEEALLDGAALGTPLLREDDSILELKDAGNGPGWCQEVVTGLEFTAYSKFRLLLEALGLSRPSNPHVD